MPKGTRHVEAGILRFSHRGYELMVDDGGVWHLDIIWPARTLIGRRVIVEGARGGFDLLDVTSIRVADPSAVEPHWHHRIMAYLGIRP